MKETQKPLTSNLNTSHLNIVLIGMPGVGKTTIGQTLAEELNRPFVDADIYLAQKLGPLGDFIQKKGLPQFRIEESQNLRNLGKQQGIVLATGGGCVTVPENFDALRQNGRVYFLRRPITELATTGRVLVKDGLTYLAKIEKERMPLYEYFAHVIIDNLSIESTIKKIIKDFQSFENP